MDYCFGETIDDPATATTIAEVNERLDGFTKSMLYDERDSTKEQKESNGGEFDPSVISFPPRYDNDSRIIVNCFEDESKIPAGTKSIYEMPQVDEFYGDLGFFDNMCYYGKYSDGVFGYSFDENADPESKDEWKDISGSDNIPDNLKEARQYFNGIVANPVYGVPDVRKLQNPPPDILKKKQLNDWEEVDIDNLGNKNQILSALLGDNFDGDSSDMWISLIAFSGFAAHRTGPIKKNEEHPEAYFVNDVTFLSQYDVRPGYKKYGAAAYFDAKYHLKEIFLSDPGQSYFPPDAGNRASTKNEWDHAKWAWKVSVSVATFLVDMLAHSRFRESSGLIKAIQENLGVDHPLRRFLTPFTVGTVKANRVFNEFLRENGLYHRAFAFKYAELQRLIRDSMADAPALQSGQVRAVEDQMKYRFRLFRKKVVVMKKLPDEIYPIYTDVWDFWVATLKFVEEYINVYYGDDDKDDEKLKADAEVVDFYNALLKNLKINEKYRLKKFNIINILTHFICNATIWNHHTNSAVSFEYSVDPDFTGLKIGGNNARQTNVIQYVEYLLVVLSKGWQFSNIQQANPVPPNVDRWYRVLLQDDKAPRTRDIFKTYYVDNLSTLVKNIEDRNDTRLAPYNGVNPRYLQASISL